MILYSCPDMAVKSAGIRIVYRHVDLLRRSGFPAAVLHQNEGFQMPDVPAAPVRYLPDPAALSAGDIVVVPEGWPQIMAVLKNRGVRLFAIALNWRYAYRALCGFAENQDWRAFGVERILTHSPFIGDFLSWSMDLPAHVFVWGIRSHLYYFEPAKAARIVYIKRKAGEVEELKRILHSRNPRFTQNISWHALDGLPEAEYAQLVRESFLFLNLSPTEGLPCSLLEAMRAGTLVAGYNSVGGQRELVGSGERQNCILAENLDYVTLAQRMEPLLEDLLKGDLGRWSPIIQNGLQASAGYTWEAEEASVLGLWRDILKG